jgi:peptide deformylase
MLFGNKERYVVRTLGDSVLRAKAAVIPAVTPEIRALAERMIRAMRVFDGIGLAAPQIGESLRLVVIEIPQDAMEKNPTPGEALLYPRMPLVLINPQIVERSTELAERDEGCLSLPEIYAPVVRPARVVLDSDILDGGHVTVECGGLLGRCIQHELDHLDGVVFSDRVAPDERALIAPDLRRVEKYGAKHHFQRVKTA